MIIVVITRFIIQHKSMNQRDNITPVPQWVLLEFISPNSKPDLTDVLLL